MKERNKRVLVGMSGGIDSTATCLMLQERGYEIVGVTMRVWGDEPQDARELAAQMGIEHYVADERIPFKETIVKNFIDEYAAAGAAGAAALIGSRRRRCPAPPGAFRCPTAIGNIPPAPFAGRKCRHPARSGNPAKSACGGRFPPTAPQRKRG